MNYYVIGDQGQKYGPADVPTLNEWIAQGRVQPHTMLEDEASGGRIAARATPGLNFPMVPPPAAAAGSPYPRTNAYATAPAAPMAASGNAMGYALGGIALGILSPISTFLIFYGGIILGGYGVRLSWRAKDEGSPLGWVGIVLNILAIGFALVYRAMVYRHRYS